MMKEHIGQLTDKLEGFFEILFQILLVVVRSGKPLVLAVA